MAEVDTLDELETRWSAGLAASRLSLPRCVRCEHWNWYPLARCRACGNDAFTWVEVARSGWVYSFTNVHHAFVSHMADKLPYIIALVELNDAPGVRLPCRARQGAAAPAIDDRVMLEPVTDGEKSIWGFRLSDGGA